MPPADRAMDSRSLAISVQGEPSEDASRPEKRSKKVFMFNLCTHVRKHLKVLGNSVVWSLSVQSLNTARRSTDARVPPATARHPAKIESRSFCAITRSGSIEPPVADDKMRRPSSGCRKSSCCTIGGDGSWCCRRNRDHRRDSRSASAVTSRGCRGDHTLIPQSAPEIGRGDRIEAGTSARSLSSSWSAPNKQSAFRAHHESRSPVLEPSDAPEFSRSPRKAFSAEPRLARVRVGPQALCSRVAMLPCVHYRRSNVLRRATPANRRSHEALQFAQDFQAALYR